MRRAKIVATLGPASSDITTITQLIKAGMNVVRINMSHGTHESQRQVIAHVREASALLKREVAILLDLQGPKIRVDKLAQPLQLKKGERWVLGQSLAEKKHEKFIPSTYKDLVKDSRVGARILFNDGLIVGKVRSKSTETLEMEVLVGGELTSNKGINLPDCVVSAPSFTEKDKEDLLFGLGQGIDYVALSFVQKKDDIKKVKILLHELKVDIPVVAKVETQEAIDNIQEIVRIADVIMVARGDMGVELGNHKVPTLQKKIINLCNSQGKPVITATHMLESMIQNSTPTRAEASDVANAVWSGTDALMLSGETASGDYPIESVQMMNRIIEEAEKTPKERPLLRDTPLRDLSSSIQVAASLIAEKVTAKWIISVTEEGNSCIKMSRFRPRNRVLGVTRSLKTLRRLCLLWGIFPFHFEPEQGDSFSLEKEMTAHLKERGLVKNGDKLVYTHGDGTYFTEQTANSIRVEIVKEKGLKLGQSEGLQEVEFERGKIMLDTALCSSCQKCVSICPHDIWEVSSDKQRRTQINVKNAEACSLDMQCVTACPTGAIEIFAQS